MKPNGSFFKLFRTHYTIHTLLFLSATLFLTSCGGSKKADETPSVTVQEKTGSGEVKIPAVEPSTPVAGVEITGVVTFAGTAPASTMIKMGGNPECSVFAQASGGTTDAGDVLIKDGKIQNTFVYIKGGAEEMTFSPPAEPVVIANTGCRYEPRVVGLQTGQPLQLINNDPTLHNIHALPKTNKAFNVGLPTQGSKLNKKFDTEEIMVSLKCDLHSWMQGWIGVLPHPFFDVSKTDGSFTLKNVPPGTYVIEAWHERLGSLSQMVTVGDTPVQVSFDYQSEG